MPSLDLENVASGDGAARLAKNDAVRAAAAAAAAGAAAYAIQKAASRGSGNTGVVDRAKDVLPGRGKKLDVSSVASSARSTVSRGLVPLAEHLADSAGRYVAEQAPDFVRDRIVPRFAKAFNDAR